MFVYPAVNPKTLSNLPGYLGLDVVALNRLAAVARAPDTVWLLGAGASHPLRPTWRELQTNMVEASLDLAGWPAEIPRLTAFKRDLMRDSCTRARLDWWKLLHTPDDFLRLRYETVLLGSETSVEPRPYLRFFERLPSSNLILTTNQDGLLHHFAFNVVCLHGCVYENFWFAPGLDGVRRDVRTLVDLRHEAASEWGFDPGPAPWLYMPGDPESSELWARLDDAAKCLRSAKALVVIGYSFSDVYLLEMLSHIMLDRRAPCTTIIIDPDPEIDRAAVFRDIWGRRDIDRLCARWDALAQAIATVACFHRLDNMMMLREHVDEVCLELQIEARKFPLLT